MAQSFAQDVAIIQMATDMAGINPAMAGASAYVQNKGPGPALVAFSSAATAPSAGYILLGAGDMTYGTAAHVYAKTLNGVGVVAIGTTD